MGLAEVFVDLQIVPGQPAHKAAIDVVQSWTGLEEQEEFATDLLQDSHHEFMTRVNKTRVEVKDPSDDELNDEKDVDSTGAGAGWGVDANTIDNFRLSLALWSISPNHVTMEQEICCIRRGRLHQRLD